MEKAHLEAHWEAQEARWLEEWKAFLSIPSISADQAHLVDCVRCAEWLVCVFGRLDWKRSYVTPQPSPWCLRATTVPIPMRKPSYTTGITMSNRPIRWRRGRVPPFSPTYRNGRMFARGAQDNKGQTFYVLKALETLLQQGALRYNVRLLIEGEEETSSRAFANALPAWEADLKADVLMVCDTSSLSLETPTVTMGLRGSLFVGIRLDGPGYDVHSGSFGGLIRNPAVEMAHLLSTLHDAQGRIAVKGFLDDVAEPSEEDKAMAHKAPYAWADISDRLGVALDGGESGLPPAYRVGFRPTIEVNGLFSGYNGPGVKTIIPAYATAKITSRLAARQDPERALRCLIAHLHQHAPPSLRFRIEAQGIGGPALQLSVHEPWIQHAARILAPLAQREVAFAWEGEIDPHRWAIGPTVGRYAILVGFGLEEDRIHSPNESFSLDQMRMGFLYVATFLSSSR